MRTTSFSSPFPQTFHFIIVSDSCAAVESTGRWRVTSNPHGTHVPRISILR
jgi:hypothetical protein